MSEANVCSNVSDVNENEYADIVQLIVQVLKDEDSEEKIQAVCQEEFKEFFGESNLMTLRLLTYSQTLRPCSMRSPTTSRLRTPHRTCSMSLTSTSRSNSFTYEPPVNF